MQTISKLESVSQDRLTILTECDTAAVKACLREKGAVMIRAKAGLDDFEALSNDLMIPIVHHSTTTTIERDPVNADGTTSTVNKGIDAIPLHREGSYAPGCPDLLMLYCVRPADAGGATMLCDGVRLVESLPEHIRQFVDEAVLKWTWRVSPERWMVTFGVKSKEQALVRLAGIRSKLPKGESIDADFDGDTLCGAYCSPCVIRTKWRGLRSLCNSLLIYHYREESAHYPKSIYKLTLADGTPFPASLLEIIAEHAEAETTDVVLKENDILLFDNSRYMHGRRSFADSRRRIFVRMGHVREDV